MKPLAIRLPSEIFTSEPTTVETTPLGVVLNSNHNRSACCRTEHSGQLADQGCLVTAKNWGSSYAHQSVAFPQSRLLGPPSGDGSYPKLNLDRALAGECCQLRGS